MTGELFDVLPVLGLLAIAGVVAFPTEARVKSAGEHWARNWKVIVPVEVVPAFDRRTRLNCRLLGLGIASVAVAIASGLSDGPSPGPMLVFELAILMSLVLWRIARGVPMLDAVGGTRVARARATVFSDYLPWWSLLVIGVASFGPMAYLAYMDPGGRGPKTLFLATALQAAVGSSSAILLAKVATRPLPAADETQLRLQDADRASAMCHILVLPLGCACFLMIQIQERAILHDVWGFRGQVLIWSPMLAYGVINVIAKSRFRKRLWGTPVDAGGRKPVSPLPNGRQQ